MVCLLSFFYFLYYYAWTREREFTNWTGALLYYFCPAQFAILLFVSTRLKRSLRINLALFICFGATAVYASEFFLSLWFDLPSVRAEQSRETRARIAKASGIDFDTRSLQQVVVDLRRQGIDAEPSVFPGLLLRATMTGKLKSIINIDNAEVLPLSGVANKYTVLCNEGGKYVSYASDSRGFNNPIDLWGKPSVDVVAVGDSFIHGWCVPPDKTIVSNIRKRYPASVSLGMDANGPLAELAGLKEYARLLRPKIVLWFYYEGNDLDDLNKEAQTILKSYLTEGFSQNLCERQTEIDKALADYIEDAEGESTLRIKLSELRAVLRSPRPLPNGLAGVVTLTQLRTRLGLVEGRERHIATKDNEASSNAKRPVGRVIKLLNQVLLEAKKTVNG